MPARVSLVLRLQKGTLEPRHRVWRGNPGAPHTLLPQNEAGRPLHRPPLPRRLGGRVLPASSPLGGRVARVPRRARRSGARARRRAAVSRLVL